MILLGCVSEIERAASIHSDNGHLREYIVRGAVRLSEKTD